MQHQKLNDLHYSISKYRQIVLINLAISGHAYVTRHFLTISRPMT
jgi:hypothetical protein